MSGCGVGAWFGFGAEGVGVAAGEQGGVHGSAKLVEGAGGAGRLEGAGDGGDAAVGRDGVGGVEFAASEGHVA